MRESEKETIQREMERQEEIDPEREQERESVRERDREKPKERRDMGRMRELNTRQYRVKINPSDILNATVILSDNRNEPVKILNTHPCIYLFMLAPQVESALDATMCNHSP